MGKISKGLSLRSRPLQSPSRASPVPALPQGSPSVGLSPSSQPYLGSHPAARRQGWRHRGQPGAVSSLPVPAACPRTASRAGRSSEEQPQPGAREQAAAGEQQPRLPEPRRASSCASHMPAMAACCRGAPGFLPAPGPRCSGLPSSQTIPGNLQQAQPQGAHSFAQRGGEILSQDVPPGKGKLLAGCCRAANGGERALRTWRCLQDAGLPSTPSRRLPPAPRRHGGQAARTYARASPVLLKGFCFFLSGLDALQEQLGDLNPAAAEAPGLQVKTS